MAAKQSRRSGPAEGIQFPITDKGDRSSSVAGKAVFQAAIAAVDEKGGEKVVKEKNWRFGYTKHVVRHLELSANSSDDALKIALAGLDHVYDTFDFIRDGETVKVKEAMKKFTGTFETGFIQGRVVRPDNYTVEVPYKGTVLKGRALVEQIERWEEAGTIEESCAQSLKACLLHPEWLDLSHMYFVLQGAGSAMGPFSVLTTLGANIIALDIDRPDVWKRLITKVVNSPGSITFPMKKPQKGLEGDSLYENCGCDLFTQAPEIKNWVTSLYPKEELVIGSYAYLDGELHVRLAVAMDMIVKGVTESRKGVSIAYLNTPTQTFIVPEEVKKASDAHYNAMTLLNLCMLPLRLWGGKRFLYKNFTRPAIKGADGVDRTIIDSLVVAQGPNYALAKTLQHWRAIIAREAGHIVSSNIAPSTATASVVHNRSFAWAYGGMHFFEPMEVFQQETSNAVMTALLINDLCNAKSLAHPKIKLSHPYELFQHSAFHGGIWRQAYSMNSVGEVAAVLYFIDKAKVGILLAIIAVVAALLIALK